ncbi:MAG: response regulator transcription factor [Bacteroidota bacterium]
MNAITAIIIDDEEHNRNLLSTLLKKHCPLVEVICEAANVDDAFEKINDNKPQLVFLDIRMPNKSGFDLLKQFTEINFEVIFISAFDEYAITAFEFNALGYILKPVDYSKLIKSVDKAITKVSSNRPNEEILHFTKTIANKNDLINKIAIHHNDKVVFLSINEIIAVEGNGNTCVLKMLDNKNYYSSKDLKLFEAMLEKAGNFIRISRSVIVNVDCIKAYSKGEICDIELTNGMVYEVPRRKKAEVLSKMRPNT